jgi:PAS domain S-box-containing protein
MSPASQHVWGHAPEALDGTSVLDLVNPEDRGAAQAFLKAALAQPSTNMTTELRLLHAGGTWHDFEVIANNLLDQPAVDGIVVTYRDVTERKTFEHNSSRWRSMTR